jgi:hypothetical protein
VSDKPEPGPDEVLRSFGRDYVPADPWDEWATTIEVKLNRNGQIAVGAAVGALAALVLIGLQGKIVINLMKAQGQIIESLNSFAGVKTTQASPIPTRPVVDTGPVPAPDPDVQRAKGNVEYSRPSGAVREAPAPDPDELDELRRLMNQASIETDLQGKNKEIL